MGNHLHLVVRMHTGDAVSDGEVRRRYLLARGRDNTPELLDGQIPFFREKWASLSGYVKEIRQSFSRWFSRNHA
jgi:hypothetical protein